MTLGTVDGYLFLQSGDGGLLDREKRYSEDENFRKIKQYQLLAQGPGANGRNGIKDLGRCCI